MERKTGKTPPRSAAIGLTGRVTRSHKIFNFPNIYKYQILQLQVPGSGSLLYHQSIDKQISFFFFLSWIKEAK